MINSSFDVKLIPFPFLTRRRCDFTVDDIQIINAAAHGASAITLSPEMTVDLKSQVDLCKKHGMEALVMIKSVEDGAFSTTFNGSCYV